jgi:hypothetical protein
MVTASYEPTGISLPLLGASAPRIGFNLTDARPNPLLLGITNDTYRERILLTSDPALLAEMTFQHLLSDAGLLLNPGAPLVYQVEIKRFSCESAHRFGAKARASASFKVNIVSEGVDLGGKLITGIAVSDQGAAEGPSASCTRAFSQALSQAIEKAVSDEQLMTLIRNGGG